MGMFKNGSEKCWKACSVVGFFVVWAFLAGGGAALMVRSTYEVCVPCGIGFNATEVNGATACLGSVRGVVVNAGNPCVQHTNTEEFVCAIIMMCLAAFMIGGPTLFVMDSNGEAFIF